MAFFKYTGTYVRVYSSYDISAQPGLVYDLGVSGPPADGNWTADPGPATGTADNASVVYPPGVVLTSLAPLVPAWVTGVQYAAGQLVWSPNGGEARALTTHLSGVYATDLAAGKWSDASATFSTLRNLRSMGLAPVSTNPNGLNYSSRTVPGGPATFRTEHWATFSTSHVRLVFGNYFWTGTGGVPNLNPIVITASVENVSPSGVGTEDQPRIPVTFNGKRHKIIDGNSIVLSDPVPIALLKGSRFFTRTFVSAKVFGNAPAAPTVATSTSGGAMPTGQAYSVALSYVFPDFETVMGTSVVGPTTGAGSANKYSITAPAAAAGALGYRVWLTSNGGSGASTFYRMSGVIDFASNVDVLFVPSATAPSQTNQVGYPTGNALLGGSAFFSINNGEGSVAGNDITDTGIGPSISQANANSSYGPLAVVAAPAAGPLPASPAIIGDSIQAGKGDDGIGGNTRGGSALRALTGIGSTLALTSAFTSPAAAQGFIKAGPIPGETLTNWITTVTSSPRAALTMMASTVISNYGTNDLGLGTSAVQALLVKIANFYTGSGTKFIQETYLPKTTSTDGWRTSGNQTVNGDNAVRIALNAWLRDPAGFKAACATPALVDAFDVCAPIEVNAAGALTANGGFWLGNNAAATYTGTATATSATTVTDSAQTWASSGGSVAGLKGYCARIITDASTPTSVGGVIPIGYNTSTQVATLSAGWPVTPSVGATFEIYQPYTFDGVHPSSAGYGLAASAIDLTKVV